MPGIFRPRAVLPLDLDVEVTRLEVALRSETGPAVLSGLATAGTALVSLLCMTDRWGAATLSMVTVGAAGAALAAVSARQMSRTLVTARDVFLPLLRPVEHMSEARRRAARAAKEELTQPTDEVVVLPTLAAVFAVAVATWSAYLTQR